jgi:hypothetical protein
VEEVGEAMAEELKRISFDEFSENLSDIIEQVIHDHKPVLIESESGELVEVKPAKPAKSRQREFTAEDDEAFLSSAGGWSDWSDAEIDDFLKDIYESRRSSRPPVEL